MKKQRFFILVELAIFLFAPTFLMSQDMDEEKQLAFQTYFFEALKHKGIGSHQKAIEYLEKCYQIDSTNTALYFEFSKNYLILSNYYEAAYFVKRALKKEPANRWLLEHLKEIYKKQNNLNEAIGVQHKIVSLDPKKKEELILLYIQNKDFKKAIKLIGEIEQNGIMSARIKNYKSFILNRQNQRYHNKPEEKISQTNNLQKLKTSYSKTNNFQVLQQILMLEAKNMEYDSLLATCNKAILFFPAQPVLYKMKALALNNLQKYNEAIQVLTNGIDFVIDNVYLEADFLEQLAISYKGLNQLEKSKEFQQKADELRQKPHK